MSKPVVRLEREGTQDQRVPVVGDRVKVALEIAGLSEKEAARLLAVNGWAKISQPALNNICTGKTVTCRRSVRDGIAVLSTVPSTWLGGEGPEAAALFTGKSLDSAAKYLSRSGLRAVALVVALGRAWQRDHASEPMPETLLNLHSLLDFAYLRPVDDTVADDAGSQRRASRDEEYARSLLRALFLVLERPAGGEWVNWDALIGLSRGLPLSPGLPMPSGSEHTKSSPSVGQGKKANMARSKRGSA